MMMEDFIVMEMANPRDRVLTRKARDASPYFMAGEFLWMYAGRSDLAGLVPYNTSVARFSLDENKNLFGAYGPRIMAQFLMVVAELKKNPYSRQGYVSVHQSEDNFGGAGNNYPCNVGFHLQMENDKLAMNVFVRSQDMMFGFPYDAFHWTMLQEIAAKEIGAELGTFRNVVSNCHVYLKHEDQLKRILNEFHDTPEDGIMEKMPAKPLEIRGVVSEAFDAVTKGGSYNDTGSSYWNGLLDVCWAKIQKDHAGMDLTIPPSFGKMIKYREAVRKTQNEK